MLANISSYKIVRLIGAGGMGEVYEAMHEKIERRAAIKVLRSAFAENQEVVQRFLNEARAVNIISHPSLVNIYEFGVSSNGSPFIVMEFLEGETLRQRLTRAGRFAPREAMAITRQIASALAAAHAKQIVHRDLKPVNVMIVPDPDMVDGERVKVLDFGIAKLVSEVGSEVLTRTGTSMGTPRYMSPEQCKSARDVTDRSDVYTLGLMLYEMLCGESPYAEVKAEVMLMAAQMTEPAPPLGSKGTEASAELCALVHRMLDKNPESRPSAAEVLGILRRMTGGLPSMVIPTISRAKADSPAEPSGYSSPALTAAALPSAPGAKPSLLSGRYLIAIAAGTLLIGIIGLVLVLHSLAPPPAPLSPVVAYWHLVSDPADAEVVDDSGKVVGRTPLTRLRPQGPGAVTFTLRHRGFVDRRVTLNYNEDPNDTVTLVPLPPPPPPPADPPVKSLPVKKKGGKNKNRGGRSH